VKQIRYLAPARFELFTATTRYREVAERLAAEFEREYLGALKRLQEYPQSAPVLEEPIRRTVLRKFPYSVLYRVVGDVIEIVAVMHHKQRPGYWLGRIRGSL
jgi:plasmid stabilization system protein ParE